jgi:hypothetical protein
MNDPHDHRPHARTRARAQAKINVQRAHAEPYAQTTNPSLTEIRIIETFSGDIEGASTVRALRVARRGRFRR